jgi:LysM repeat protein
MSASDGARLGRVIRAVGALALIVAVMAGVPALLIALGQVPHAVPSVHDISRGLRSRDDGQLAGVILAAGVWICWALFTVSVIGESWGALRRRPVAIMPGLGWCQRPAAALVTAVAVGFAAAPLGLASAGGRGHPDLPASAPNQPAVATSAGPAASSQFGAETLDQPVVERRVSVPARPSYVVQRRDTLWGIAQRYLGDPLRYTEIARLNPQTVGPDNEISPGAVLTLPADARGLPGDRLPDRQAASTGGSRVTQVTVHPGDTLWDIEERETGSGQNWVRGWQANRNRAEPDGQRYTDPDLIRPGWKLSIPIPAGTPSTKPPSTKPPAPPPAPPRDQPMPVPDPELPGPAPAPALPTVDGSYAPAEHAPMDARPAASAAELPVLAFAGGGTLLAAVCLTALVRYRRRQFRFRHPGRTIGATPPELLRIERSVLAAGGAGLADLTRLDHALRSLVQSLARTPGAALPDVIAACLTVERLELVLASPAWNPPAPWRADLTRHRWTIDRTDPLPYDPDDRAYCFAPFPTLASIGYTAAGEHWLVDLERVASLSLRGDPQRCVDLARYLAAELAHNTWSEMLRVTLVGFGREIAEINPDRVSYTDDLDGAIEALEAQATSVTEALAAAKVDVLTGRLRDVAADAWAPHVLLVAPHLTAHRTGLDRLLGLIAERRGRTAVALVVADQRDSVEARWQLTVDERGVLRVPALGVELVAHRIPVEEAGQLARMLALAASTEDRTVPASRGDQPWDDYADVGGGLRADLAVASERGAEAPPRPQPVPSPHGWTVVSDFGADDVPAGAGAVSETDQQVGTGETGPAPVLQLAEAGARAQPELSAPSTGDSVLPLPAQTYLDAAATTAEDLKVLAPVVTDQLRDSVQAADPGLDADLADWHDPNSPRPKVTLLGPVAVRAQGALPQRNPRLQWNTEIVAYLATRPTGVSSERFGTDLWPDDPDIAGKTKVRQSISIVRAWLGINPNSGHEYLPKGFMPGSVGVYRLEDALTDAELFRRLRLRGVARGTDGIADLRRALDLVTGVPFDERRPGGYGWLADMPLDHEYAGMIVDVAHIVATHHLAAAEPDLAASAAKVALRAGSSEDVPLLDLVAACDAQDNRAEADAYVKRILANHDAEVEEDLPPRTAQILFRRQWLSNAS